MAEEDYQTNIMGLFTYLNSTWSLPAKCTEPSSVFTPYLVSGRLRLFTLFRFCFVQFLWLFLVRISAILNLFRFIIFAIFIIHFSIHRSLTLIG